MQWVLSKKLLVYKNILNVKVQWHMYVEQFGKKMDKLQLGWFQIK